MKSLRIAVTGMHRGDNPQPGSSIVSSIRRRWPDAFIVGLVYDAYESGIYAADGPDICHVMPNAVAGLDTYLERLAEVRAQDSFDLLIPTLDAEIDLLAGTEEILAGLGIRVVLPDVKTLARCGKAKLPALAADCGVEVPETAVVKDLGEAREQAQTMGYPVFVKGHFYDAIFAGGPEALTAAGAGILADWGPPLILQKPLRGNEFNVLGLGDGKGGLLGSCAVRKLILTDKGKGNGSIIVRDARLDEITLRIIAETHWIGPFELEFIRDHRDNDYRLIEINPRFPAWVGFPAQLGANFAAAWVEWMTTGRCEPLPDLTPGRFFIRHQTEVTGDIGQLSAMLGHPFDTPSVPSRIQPLAS